MIQNILRMASRTLILVLVLQVMEILERKLDRIMAINLIGIWTYQKLIVMFLSPGLDPGVDLGRSTRNLAVLGLDLSIPGLANLGSATGPPVLLLRQEAPLQMIPAHLTEINVIERGNLFYFVYFPSTFKM